MTRYLVSFVFLFVAVNLFAQVAIAPEGNGTAASPYLMASLENLFWASQNTGSWGGVLSTNC
jgi:hypothetical protein